MMVKGIERMATSATIKRDHVLQLMWEDGVGPDEALEMASSYAVRITGRASPTAVLCVEQRIRGFKREVIRDWRRSGHGV